MGPSWSMGLPGVVRQAPVSGKVGAGRTSAARTQRRRRLASNCSMKASLPELSR